MFFFSFTLTHLFFVWVSQGPVETDGVMFATGRRPNTDRPDLGLSAVGVELDKAGAVQQRKRNRCPIRKLGK